MTTNIFRYGNHKVDRVGTYIGKNVYICWTYWDKFWKPLIVFGLVLNKFWTYCAILRHILSVFLDRFKNDSIRFLTDFVLISSIIWTDFQQILYRLSTDIEQFLDKHWSDFEKILQRPLTYFDIILITFWSYCRRILIRTWTALLHILSIFWAHINSP